MLGLLWEYDKVLTITPLSKTSKWPLLMKNNSPGYQTTRTEPEDITADVHAAKFCWTSSLAHSGCRRRACWTSCGDPRNYSFPKATTWHWCQFSLLCSFVSICFTILPSLTTQPLFRVLSLSTENLPPSHTHGAHRLDRNQAHSLWLSVKGHYLRILWPLEESNREDFLPCNFILTTALLLRAGQWWALWEEKNSL